MSNVKYSTNKVKIHPTQNIETRKKMDNRKMTADKLKIHVHETFNLMHSALDIREQLLTRQIDAIHHQNRHKHRKSKLIDQMKFLPDNQENVLANIRTLGKFNLDNFQTSDPFTVEDYICPNDDHDFMYKVIKDQGLNGNQKLEIDESTIVDFSNNKALIKENTNNINDSIINMTINESRELIEESRELIEKAKLFEFDEFLAGPEKNSVSMIDNLDTVNKNTSKIKIHNCTGTINLKNISKLTINTNCRGSDRVKDNVTFSSTDKSSSTITSGNDVNCATYNCEFYNRLINEIKNSIKRSDNGDIPSSTKGSSFSRNKGSSSFTSDSNSFDSHCKKILLKNIKNLQIHGGSELNGYLNANTITHPVQIEEWLKQIISETEIEPMQNLDILEHSIINTPTTP